MIAENDPEEQEKRIKYNDLVANVIIFQNVVDMTRTLRELKREGYEVNREDVAALSPYLTRHIKRFGDYYVDLGNVPQPLQSDVSVWHMVTGLTWGRSVPGFWWGWRPRGCCT